MSAWVAAPVLLWLGAATWFDLRRRRVPHWAWNAVPLAVAALYRLATGGWNAVIVVSLPAFFLAWRLGVWGGADASAAMALVLFFPDARLLVAMLLAGLAAVLTGRMRGARCRLPGLPVLFLATAGYLTWSAHLLYSHNRKATSSPLVGAESLFWLIPVHRRLAMRNLLKDLRGDMAEKAVVMFLIILAAIGAFTLLGGRIAEVVTSVAGGI